jgi:hypothetical protein
MSDKELIKVINRFSLESPTKFRAITFFSFFLILYGVVIFLQLDTLSSVLDNHWQTADIVRLKQDPIAALLHLHSQPPLFNFFFWLMAVIPGNAYDHFVIFNCLAQSLVALIVFEISRHYVKSAFVGLIIAILYLLSPAVLLNSAYAFYPPLTSMGFALLIYAFYVFKDKPKLAAVLIGFSICYLYMIRSSFSLPAAFILLSIFAYITRKYLSKFFLALTLLISISILLSLPIKNYVMYGFFGSSSWTPLNLVMTFSIKTPLGLFATPEVIRKEYPNLQCKKSYGLLDTEDKKVNGEPNYNSCYYIAYINAQMPNVVWKNFNLRTYLGNVKHNIGSYFDTPDGYYFLKNREKIELYITAFNTGLLTLPFKFHQTRVAMILLVFYLIYRVRKDKAQFPSLVLTVLALHFFAHVLTDGGESRRHVFDVEFIFYIIFSMFVAAFIEKRSKSALGLEDSTRPS